MTECNILAKQTVSDVAEIEPIKLSLVADLDSFIPEEARAESEQLPEEMQEYVQSGLLTPTAGMYQLTNRFQGKLFACVVVDDTGTRTVHFRQQYADGSYSEEFCVHQSDLLCAVAGSKMVDSFLAKEARSCQRRIMRDYLSKCSGKEMLNISEVILALAEALGKLPTTSAQQEISKAHLYAKVLNALKEDECSGYYHSRQNGLILLSENDIFKVSESMGIPSKKLLEMLRNHKLLYLTSSCIGYQVKVPTYRDKQGKLVYQWIYALYDMAYIKKRQESPKEVEAHFDEEYEL